MQRDRTGVHSLKIRLFLVRAPHRGLRYTANLLWTGGTRGMDVYGRTRPFRGGAWGASCEASSGAMGAGAPS
jgi:hypothetical protein